MHILQCQESCCTLVAHSLEPPRAVLSRIPSLLELQFLISRYSLNWRALAVTRGIHQVIKSAELSLELNERSLQPKSGNSRRSASWRGGVSLATSFIAFSQACCGYPISMVAFIATESPEASGIVGLRPTRIVTDQLP